MINKVLAIIPARGKSSGLQRKNIIDLAGKPLIEWTIEASLNSKFINKTIVSSDNLEILEISKNCGAEIIERPANLANDFATSESVVRHVIENYESEGKFYDTVVLLQPTSPLRDSMDIDRAFKIMSNSDINSVISVCDFDNKILKAFVLNSDGFLEGVSNNKYPFMRRQDLPSVFMPNGAIYIFRKKLFMESNSFFTDRTSYFLMSLKKSIDIDNMDDLNNASLQLQQ